jgi:hypothetical protein
MLPLQTFRHAGAASADGTWAYADSFRQRKDPRGVSANHYNSVFYFQGAAGDDTLALSSLGVSTYVGAADDASDEAQLSAILFSVMRGWNVIDTGAGWGGVMGGGWGALRQGRMLCAQKCARGACSVGLACRATSLD